VQNKRKREVLAQQNVVERILVEQKLSADEIMELARALGGKVHDLLRANLPVYKGRKEELLTMEETTLAEVMATEPTLIKRPIVQTSTGIVVGLFNIARFPDR
jgi:arsenate reductase-like glutaredoxin family protein